MSDRGHRRRERMDRIECRGGHERYRRVMMMHIEYDGTGSSMCRSLCQTRAQMRLYKSLSSMQAAYDGVTNQNLKCVVAIGKFEALHLGHRQLAYAVTKVVEESNSLSSSTQPHTGKYASGWLLRLRGVDAALQRSREDCEDSLPLVATIDRSRVLDEWSYTLADPNLNNDQKREIGERNLLRECSISFESIRHLSPQSFVNDILHEQLQVAAVVVGIDFRFGYRAEGDVTMLRTLCEPLSIEVFVVDLLTMCDIPSQKQLASESTASAIRISSTRIMESIHCGNVATLRSLLGRKYRLIAKRWNIKLTRSGQNKIMEIDHTSISNLSPGPGVYHCTVKIISSQASNDIKMDQQIITPSSCINAVGNKEYKCTVVVKEREDSNVIHVIDDNKVGLIYDLSKCGDGHTHDSQTNIAIDFD